MNSIEYRHKTIGKCPRCGTEVASLTSYTGAVLDDSGEDNSPLRLEKFRGRYMCTRCAGRIVREESTLRKIRRTNKGLKYLEEIGFKKEV